MKKIKKRCAICKNLVKEFRRPHAGERHGAGVKKNQWVCEGEHVKPFKSK